MALINFESKINAINFAYSAKLRLFEQKTEINP